MVQHGSPGRGCRNRTGTPRKSPTAHGKRRSRSGLSSASSSIDITTSKALFMGDRELRRIRAGFLAKWIVVWAKARGGLKRER